MVGRYGEAIRADLLAEYHKDLFADFFRDKLTCDELLGFIDQLPRRSRLGAALADDDELAEAMGDSKPVSGPSIRFNEWSPEVQYLADLVDRMSLLVTMVSEALGARVDVPHADRPESARDRLQQRREDDYFADLEAEIADAHRRWADENHDGEV